MVTALNLTAEGMGFTIILESVIKNFKPKNKVVCYRFDKGFFRHSMNICYRKDMYMSKAILQIIELIKDSFAGGISS